MTAFEAFDELERRLRGRLNMNVRTADAARERGDTVGAAIAMARAEGYRIAINDMVLMIAKMLENPDR